MLSHLVFSLHSPLLLGRPSSHPLSLRIPPKALNEARSPSETTIATPTETTAGVTSRSRRYTLVWRRAGTSDG